MRDERPIAFNVGGAMSDTEAEELALRDRPLHVFQITECDWYAGENSESCRLEYRKTVGDEEADIHFREFGDPIQMSEEELDKLTIVDVDEPGQPRHTFRKALDDVRESGKWPAFIASTEY